MVLVCAQEILLVQVYWPLSQDHQNQLCNRFNFYTNSAKQQCVYSYFMFKEYNSTKSVIQSIKCCSLFARNDQYHNYNTRQSRSLHPSVGKGEAIYRSFSFHGVNIWNYLSKHDPTNVSYNHFNKLTKSYVLNNDIIYRLV